jgi:PAS domain S-box-containing protein
MDTERNLLIGALALQTGLIDSAQFTEAWRSCATQPDELLDQWLLDRGWILPADKPHLEYLVQRTLQQHHDDPRATRIALHSEVRRSLAALEQIDSECTVAVSPPVLDASPSSLPTSQPSPDTRYAFLSLHGTGGIGRVWRAWDRHLEREVAIKELLPDKAGLAKVAARFMREAQLTGQLEHPGIVPVYELGERPDTREPFYSMRLVRGRTLTDAIAAYHSGRTQGRADPLDFAALLTAFAAVCHTVAYAHFRGVLHRDLKGDNIVLGDFGEVIVLDWGLAKRLGQSEEELGPVGIEGQGPMGAVLTLQGDVVGTPAFMAPEQASGRLDQIDQRTDIYGLGAIFYQILTGRPPFVGGSTVEVLLRVVQGHPAPPHETWPDVPVALEAMCLKALAKDPDQRYASATDFALQVQGWQDLQRRQAENALRRQTEVLRSILNNMSEGVLVANAAGNLILMNPAAERMIGPTPEGTLVGARRRNTFYRPDGSTPLDAEDLPLMRAIHGEEVNDAELVLHSDRVMEATWISANARPLRDESGQLVGGVGVYRDITERKRAEMELHRSRERFELAVRGSQDGLWDWDLRTNEVYYSPRWKSIIGYEDHEITHRLEEWEQRLHPDEREQVLAANYAHADGTTPLYEYEYRLRHKDGSYRWILARGVALRAPSGKAYRMAGSHVDITDRKRAEEELAHLLVREREARSQAEAAVRVIEEARDALRRSEEQYRSLADLIPGAVWTARADGSIDYANQFWLRYTGLTLEQTFGSGWTAVLHPEDTERVMQTWSQALQQGEPVEVEYRIKRSADGAYRWFLARGQPWRDREGRIVKWFGMLTEIEEQKRGGHRSAPQIG